MIDLRLSRDVTLAEGCRLEAYQDSLGYWTIGVGHLLLPVDHNWAHETCTQEQADTWLASDLTSAQTQAQTLPEWPALNTDCRQNAVIELVFNLGLSKWLQFVKTRNALQGQLWASAAGNLLDSTWAKQVGQIRSQRLHDYILDGVYP